MTAPATSTRYRLIGGNGSPYSMKLRAIMRYRRLPFDWVSRTSRNRDEFAGLRPQIVPILQFPEDGSYHVDSTPLAYALEQRHPGERSILPAAPGQAFLAHLIEDMADEWLTKAMFHYRWAYDADIHYAGYWIADDSFPDDQGPERDRKAHEFARRQIERMPLVGCTPQNAPVIEDSYRRILALLESHVGLHDYLFGSRPSLADFGLFGQLKTLATDPTPMAIMRREAQRTESWVRQLDDASGIEGEWLADAEILPSATRGLLTLVGSVYLPFLDANARAVEQGRDSFSLELLGRDYSQAPFRYQAKCLHELRTRWRALDEAARAAIQPLLDDTGCLAILAEGP
tara:strand:+ start:106 stop:1137 length:1032 start_codon:yes stop_codon:yes gene_type:complete